MNIEEIVTEHHRRVIDDVNKMLDNEESFPRADFPLTPRAKRVLKRAQHIAKDEKVNYVGPRHLLESLRQEPDGEVLDFSRAKSGVCFLEMSRDHIPMPPILVKEDAVECVEVDIKCEVAKLRLSSGLTVEVDAAAAFGGFPWLFGDTKTSAAA